MIRFYNRLSLFFPFFFSFLFQISDWSFAFSNEITRTRIGVRKICQCGRSTRTFSPSSVSFDCTTGGTFNGSCGTTSTFDCPWNRWTMARIGLKNLFSEKCNFYLLNNFRPPTRGVSLLFALLTNCVGYRFRGAPINHESD